MKEVDIGTEIHAFIEGKLKAIEALTDPEEQGYQSAPLFCQLNGCDWRHLRDSTLMFPLPDSMPMNQARDRGLLRWCSEQQAKEDQCEDPSFGWVLGDE